MKSTGLINDHLLLSRMKQDDENAFVELYNRYSKKVRALAYPVVHSKEITQEITQNIFATLWERRHLLEINTSFSNYLAVAVKYQVINHIKGQIAFRKHSHYYKAFLKVSEEETLKSVEFNDLAEALEEGVQKLPKKTQQVFRLNRLEGKSVSEIADHLSLSEKAIRYHLSRCLKELRFHLKEFLFSLLVFLFF